MTFVNHGCNGSYNTGVQWSFTEQADLQGNEGLWEEGQGQRYNPFRDRAYPDLCGSESEGALRDIEVGEEILDNYMDFGGGGTGRARNTAELVAELRRLCSGGSGSVTNYEEGLTGDSSSG